LAAKTLVCRVLIGIGCHRLWCLPNVTRVRIQGFGCERSDECGQRVA
jgi:hypothetical protein